MAFGMMFDRYDKPFERWEDLAAFTWCLVFIGYRLYRLQRRDNGQMQRVWAKSKESVLQYAPGSVMALPLETIDRLSVIVLDEADGGHVNVNGTHISSQKRL